MKYKVSVIKKIAFLVMTMALAVALVACQGAAGVAGEPGAPALLPPLKVGEIADKALTVGDDASTTALSGYFSDAQGQTLSYTATSSMPTVATAAVAEMTLTVTAVAAGASTITVTATDPDKLTAKQTFIVTVTAATTTPPPTTTPPVSTADYTLDVKGTQSVSVEGAVAANASSTAVTVTQGTPPMWEIEAVAKGTVSVFFYDASLTLLKTIKVKVNNRAPAVKTTALPKLPLTLGDSIQLAGVQRLVYIVGTEDIPQKFDGYFEDKDGDKKIFTISSAQPQYAVVAAYKKDGSAVYVDVTNSPSNVTKIYLNVSVSDGTAPAVSVKIPVELPSQILPQIYVASQAMTTGVVKDITVQSRPGVTHMITGVGFSTDATGTMVIPLDGYINKTPDKDTPDTTILVVSVPARSSISVVDGAAADILFKTSGVGTTKVTIAEYEVDTTTPRTWKKTTKKAVTFNVIVSLSPEDPVEIE